MKKFSKHSSLSSMVFILASGCAHSGHNAMPLLMAETACTANPLALPATILAMVAAVIAIARFFIEVVRPTWRK